MKLTRRNLRALIEEVGAVQTPWTDPTESEMHNAAVFLADTSSAPKLSDLLILLGSDVGDIGDIDVSKASLAIANLDQPTILKLANRLMAVGENKLNLEKDPDAMMWQNELPSDAEISWVATKLAQAASDTMGIPIEKDGERGIRAAAFREGNEMKLTRRQLRHIISEESTRLDEIMPGEHDHEISVERLAELVKQVNAAWKKIPKDALAKLDKVAPFDPRSMPSEKRAKAAIEMGLKEYGLLLQDWSRTRVDLLQDASDEEAAEIEAAMDNLLGPTATPGSPDGVNEGTRITRKQLWYLISEEINRIDEAKKKKKKKKNDVPYGDTMRDDAWSGGDNLVDPIDWDEALDMLKERRGNMSVTASQLRQIIREELAEVSHPLPIYEEEYGKDYLSSTHPDGQGEERDPRLDFVDEDSGREEGEHYRDNEEEDEKHLRDLEKDMSYDKDHIR